MMKIGFGEADYTPRGKKVNLFGQMHVRVTDVINDDICVEAMMIESENTRTVWISADALGVTAEVSKEAYEKVKLVIPGLKEEEFVISATHIHTGPAFASYNELLATDEEPEECFKSRECKSLLVNAIEKAVKTAYRRLDEAKIEPAAARIQTGVCRRVVYKDGSAAIYGKTSGPDFLKMEGRDGGAVQLLYVYNSKDKLCGIVANVPCTAQCNEQAEYVTADYWGVARNYVKEKLGEEVILLPLCRAAGDLSPHNIADRFPLKPVPKGEGGKRNARILGERIARAIVDNKENTVKVISGNVVHRQAMKEICMPGWQISYEQYQWAKSCLDVFQNGRDLPENTPFTTGNKRFDRLNSHGIIRQYENKETTRTSRIYATVLDDVVLISNPFELYIEYADRIRMALPEKIVYDVELTYDRLGYLPTSEASKRGGYSTFIFNGVCPPEAGEILVEESIELINEISR